MKLDELFFPWVSLRNWRKKKGLLSVAMTRSNDAPAMLRKQHGEQQGVSQIEGQIGVVSDGTSRRRAYIPRHLFMYNCTMVQLHVKRILPIQLIAGNFLD
jgi:hypothetical protein